MESLWLLCGNPINYTDPTGHVAWLIHGTWSSAKTWTTDFRKYIRGLFGERIETPN